MDARPPLLFLVHRIPYPPNKGDKVRSFNLLRQLSRGHRVFLGTFVDHADDQRHVRRLEEWCEAVHVVRIHPGWRKAASLFALLAGEALSVRYYRDAGMARWVDEVVRSEGIRQAIAFSGPMAQYLDHPVLEHRVIDFCDVDSAKWRDYAASHRGPMAWLYRREGKRLLRFERRAAQHADACFFVTAEEAALFRAAAPELGERIAVMQNGVDTEFFDAGKDFPDPYPPGGQAIVFTGAMDYWPNVDAVVWFAAEVFPRLRQCCPDLRFFIVGMNPTPAVLALAGPGVVVTGAVDDVRPWLAHADVVVAPLRIARGIQNKVLEAMAMGKAVVVSRASAKGLAGRGGQEFDTASAADEFVERIMDLLQDCERRRAMEGAARRCAVAAYSWGAHLRELDAALAGGRSPRGTAVCGDSEEAQQA